MAESRKGLIKQIDSVISQLKESLEKQFAQNKDLKESPQERYYVEVLKAIFAKADEHQQLVRSKMPDNRNENQLAEALKLLEDDFHLPRGQIQKKYIDSESKTYLNKDSVGFQRRLGAAKSDKESAENSVFLLAISTYGLLVWQRLCLEILDNLGADANYAKTGFLLNKALQNEIKSIKPDETEKLRDEVVRFRNVFDGLMLRLEKNRNSQLLENITGNSSLAILTRKINTQLFNSRGKSKLPTFEELEEIEKEAKAAAEAGDKVGLLHQQKKAKAVAIWLLEIQKHLAEALREYKQKSHEKVKQITQAMPEDVEQVRAAGSEIEKMNFILVLAQKMLNYEKPTYQYDVITSNYDALLSNAELLFNACVSLDVAGSKIASNIGMANGWRATGEELKQLIDGLAKKLLEFDNSFLTEENCADVPKVYTSFTRFLNIYNSQLELTEQFEKELKHTYDSWSKLAPMYFSENWHTRMQSVSNLKASGPRSFINRHKLKAAILTGIITAAALGLGIFLAATLVITWPFVFAIALGGLVVGVVTSLAAAIISDKYCFTEPVLGDIDLKEAESLLGMDLPPGATHRRSSSVESFKRLNPNDMELDEISKALRNIDALGLKEVIVDASVPKVAAPKSNASYNPFGSEEPTIRSTNPFD